MIGTLKKLFVLLLSIIIVILISFFSTKYGYSDGYTDGYDDGERYATSHNLISINPCPYCGNEKLSIQWVDTYMHSIWITCEECGLHSEPSDSIDVAINNWNKMSGGEQ